MRINTKQWKKIKADSSFTYFQDLHKNELKVAHTTLSPKLRGELEALPVHMADGGDPADKVSDKDEEEKKRLERDAEVAKAAEQNKSEEVAPAPASEPPVEDSMGTKIAKGLLGPVGYSAAKTIGEKIVSPSVQYLANPLAASAPSVRGVAAEPSAPAAPTPSVVTDAAPAAPAPVAAPELSMPASTDELKNLQSAQQKQLKGLQMEADAIAQSSAAEEMAARESRMAQEDIQAQFNNDYNSLQEEQRAILEDFRAGHIDPNKMWHEKSTPGKIATIIGILASGLSGESDNQALKVLNHQIDRDIDAQKANMNQKSNLLSALSQQMGSVRAGAEMMRNMQMGIAATQMQEAAAQAKDPIAKAKLLQQAGVIQQQFAASNAKIAAQQTVDKLMVAVNKDPSKAPQLLQAMRKVNPEAAKEMEGKYVDGVGFARDREGAQKLRDAVAASSNIKSGVNRLLEINKISGKSLNPTLKAEAESIVTGLMGPMRAALGLGTLSEGDKKMLEDLIRNPTKLMSLDSSNKKSLETLLKRTDEGIAGIAKAQGLTFRTQESQDNAKKQAFDAWAKAHPSDERAKKYLALQGK